MADTTYLEWPFFERRHKSLAVALEGWAQTHLADIDHRDADATCRKLVTQLGADGWLAMAAPDVDHGANFDLRSICLARETLARHSGLADFAFAMQGLGTGAITRFGTPEQRRRWTADVRAGRRIAAFALSEPDAGSDVSAMTTTATPVAGGYVLDGTKTWISNGGIADQYVVFARDAESERITAFVLDADTPGLTIAERIQVSAPHPLGTLAFENCRVPADQVIGASGGGMRVALGTLDLFRPSVGAAALGLARRALDEALARATTRRMFGGMLADLQLTQAALAEMATEVDAAALLVYRAAWARDSGAERITREAAMAKLYATDHAQAIIDKAVQLWGGEGVRLGSTVELLTREIRAMRIYEGASEVQKTVIARQLLSPVGAVDRRTAG